MVTNIWFFGSPILTPQYFWLIIFVIALIVVGNKMNHRHSGQKWSKLCNRYEMGSHLKQMTFQLNSGRHQEKKVLSYFGNCAQRSGGKRSDQRAGAELYLSRFPRR